MQRAMKLKVRRPRGHRQWSPEDDAYLTEHYANGNGREIALHFGVSMCVMYRRAHVLGLEKAPDFQSKYAIAHGLPQLGAAHGYKKGSVPANKGKKMSPEVYAVAQRTMFKKGHECRNKMPIGSTRINADGYLDRKVDDTGYPPNDWKAVHRLLWIETHGSIPEDHVVCFKPGTKSTVEKDITIDILECITRRERMARNTIHNLPLELKATAYAIGQLNKTIKRYGKRENGRSADAPVRHDRATEERQHESGHGKRDQ
jgi:hypothetical protein